MYNSPQEYLEVKRTQFRGQPTRDGRTLDEIPDDELLKRLLERYPGDRKQIMGIEETQIQSPEPPPVDPVEQDAQNALQKFAGGFSDSFKNRWKGMNDALGRSVDGQQSIGSGFLQAVGEGAAFIGDVGFEAVKAAAPDWIREPAGEAVEWAAGTEPVRAGMEMYGDFKEKNPELAENLEAVGNIATVIPGVGAIGKGVEKGAQAAVKGAERAGEVVQKAAAGTPNIADAAKAALPKPNLTGEAMDVAVIGPQGKKATISALERSGKQGGYAPDESFIGRIVGADKYVPTQRDIEVAEAVSGIVRKSNTPAKNIANINNKISEISETVVRPILKVDTAPFNTNTYAKRLREVEIPDFIKADETLKRTYEMVRNRFIETVRKGVKTKEGLWESRKAIDDVIEQQFGAAGFNPDKYSALQKAILDMRRATNDFIAEGIPDDAFRKEMKRLTRMYEAKHNIALDNYAIQNKQLWDKWIANNPKKWAAVKAAGLGGALVTGSTFLFGD